VVPAALEAITDVPSLDGKSLEEGSCKSARDHQIPWLNTSSMKNNKEKKTQKSKNKKKRELVSTLQKRQEKNNSYELSGIH